MNNGTVESASTVAQNHSSRHPAGDQDALAKAKRELLQAEVRLARARATVVAAEIDIKVASARLRSLVK